MVARLAPALGVVVLALVAGSLSTSPLSAAGSFGASSASIAVAADFDGDGIPDRAVLRGAFTEITLSKRQTRITLQMLPHTTGLATADIDHDGDIDLVSIADEGLRGWTNERAASFQQWTIGPPRPMRIAHMAAVHWTSGAPVLPPAGIGQLRIDILAGAGAVRAPQLARQRSRAINADRAPPRLIARDRPSRAPPRIFIS